MFRYCPRCGFESPDFLENRKIHCSSCGFLFYQNTAAAVAVLLECGEEYVIMKRARDPGKGMLDLPGGFVDPDESAEEACRREIKEELGVDVYNLRYITSHGNTYPYKGITYKTCDLLFTGECRTREFVLQEHEIQGVVFMRKGELPLEDFAFESLKIMLKEL